MFRFGSFLFLALMLFVSLDFAVCETLEDFLQMGQDEYYDERDEPVELPPHNEMYDFIIVGAGPAGCVLANRLSENPNSTVFLIEAGATENIANGVPLLAANMQLTQANWNYKSTPQKKACLGMNNNECALPRGKVLGGSSAINFMIYIRGNPEDFDKLEEAGIEGWSYDDVLPYFKRSEKANLEGLENSPYHNKSGLQSVEFVKYRTSMADAFIEGSKYLGYPINDYNGESQYGTSYVQATTRNGHRHSAAKAFVLPIIKKRKNLHVLTFATVTKILINETSLTAYGVYFAFRGRTYTIRARKEVILSSGTFNSPQLLMLSGIGPRNVLNSIGVKQLKDLQVGKTMCEHMSHFGPTFLTNSTGATIFADRVTPDDIRRFKAGDPSTKVSSIGCIEALTFMKIPGYSSDARPDIELIFVSCSLTVDNGTALKESANFKDNIYDVVYKPLEGKEHFNILIMPYHPKSCGSLWLKDSNPFVPPVINPNYYEKSEDIEVMLKGIKEAIKIAETPAMKRINATLYKKNVPGCEEFTFGTDDYWRCSIGVLSYTLHHQVGTCKMGPKGDPNAVVDNELKVVGIRNLRVADVSILPELISAHTNAVSYMIGEKAADMIKNDPKNK